MECTEICLYYILYPKKHIDLTPSSTINWPLKQLGQDDPFLGSDWQLLLCHHVHNKTVSGTRTLADHVLNYSETYVGLFWDKCILIIIDYD